MKATAISSPPAAAAPGPVTMAIWRASSTVPGTSTRRRMAGSPSTSPPACCWRTRHRAGWRQRRAFDARPSRHPRHRRRHQPAGGQERGGALFRHRNGRRRQRRYPLHRQQGGRRRHRLAAIPGAAVRVGRRSALPATTISTSRCRPMARRGPMRSLSTRLRVGSPSRVLMASPASATSSSTAMAGSISGRRQRTPTTPTATTAIMP